MNAFWLKVTALAAMLADHVGAVFFGGLTVSLFGNDWEILRIIGRIAFPILAYQIAEGAGPVSYTHLNKLKTPKCRGKRQHRG